MTTKREQCHNNNLIFLLVRGRDRVTCCTACVPKTCFGYERLVMDVQIFILFAINDYCDLVVLVLLDIV
jgi:hypothetical protein